MMTYVLVGLGGAIGSMLRYALGVLSVAAWGGSFPWGTILINISGSFLIGLIGAVTVADGFLPAGQAMRLFMMVGICGGYTTFSSFSLQTLDLVRDGRMAAGLLNVLLSVGLCFLAVAAGHYAAAAIGGRRLADGVSSPPSGHVVLAVLDRPEQVAAQLAAAARMAELNGGSCRRVEALAIRVPPRETDMLTEDVANTEQATTMRSAELARISRLKSLADGWAASASGGPVGWSGPEGDVGRLVAQAGRGIDLLVVMQPGHGADGARAREALRAALFETARPVLMLPRAPAPGRIGAVVAVAWKDDPAAHRAVEAAIPLLRQARRVALLSSPGVRTAPEILRTHGIPVELRSVASPHAQLGERLLHAAWEEEADLLVMGAFAHSPLRESVLGGVTRDVIATAKLPVFMQH